MPESASIDSLMARPVSPISDHGHETSRTFLHVPRELTLHSPGTCSSETLSLRERPSTVEEQDIESLPDHPIQHAAGLRTLASDWNLELFALVSSAVSLGALTILLARQDGQPLSTWTLPLSLNTVVSLLSVIIKTPLAFVVGTCLGQGKWAWFSKRQGPLSAFLAIEEAGRGPLGSFTLMWRLRFRYEYVGKKNLLSHKLTWIRHWVCFGAAITVALLAIDPFLQGLVQYVGKISSLADGSASVMRSGGLDIGEWYSKIPFRIQLDGLSVGAQCYGRIHPDIGLSIATQMGFVNASMLRPVQPPGLSCRTGNCTWPAFSTLGICNTCAGISSSVQKDFSKASSCPTADVWQQRTMYSLSSSYGKDSGPSALTRAAGYVNESYVCGGDSETDVRVLFRPDETYSFRNWDALLASFTVLHAEPEYWSGRLTWNDTKVYATECALRYCIQVYKPIMTSGKMVEGLIPIPFERVSGSWQPDESDPAVLGAIRDAFGNSLTRGNGSGCPLIPTSDLQLRLLDQDKPLPRGIQRIFNITQRSITTMMSSLDLKATDSIGRALSNSTNITATFDNAARLMSYQMRDTNGSPVRGDTQQWVIYIRVRWPLISGPAALLLATALFSGRIVTESRGIRLEAFKSEPLEMLLYGFDAKSRDCLRVNLKAGQSIEGEMIQLEEAIEGPELRLKDGPNDH